jgi:small GTP-binding protein
VLRQVIIFKDNENIYQQTFGKSLDQESFNNIIKNIKKDAFKATGETIQYNDFYKYRLSYITDPNKTLLFVFITDLSDKFESIKKELIKCKKEFLLMFEGVLEHRFDKKTFDIFEPTIEIIHKSLRPKISLVGFSGVGKTTITRLIRAEEIPTEHIPTITGDIATIKIGNLHFHLWDFAGQEQFSFLWNNFIHGSDAVILISDSTLENCEKSKFFCDLIQKEAPNAHTAVIGNKQDLPDALPIADIERILGMKAYSMVATDPENRNKMITIIADILEMSSEVSPLLKPLIDRDKKLAEAEKCLESGNFLEAIKLFEEVADLCITLGDDVVSQEFHEKAEKIRKILKSIGPGETQQVATATPTQTIQAPPPAPVSPISSVQPTSNPNSPTSTSNIPPAPIPHALNTEESSASSGNPISLKPVSPPPAQPVASSSPSSNVSTPVIPSKPNINIPNPSDNLSKLNQMLKSMGSVNLPKPNIEVQPQTKDESIPKISLNTDQKSSLNVPILPLASSPSSAPASTTEKLSDIVDAPQPTKNSAEKIKAQIVDLQIKISNVKNSLVDLEMKNIMGEVSDADFKAKSERLNALCAQLEKQIKELESMKT